MDKNKKILFLLFFYFAIVRCNASACMHLQIMHKSDAKEEKEEEKSSKKQGKVGKNRK